ncbi:hypothetical protein LSCM1_08268 [Leishmania martiniquensis]|uniref:Uncharacterized protein n=1 Tax=Leishmania martiniquensis TaxID=1580590 RepID=A0A836HUN6_9TRYP|nr:hypothetical protein LSCM1_08268 [Leishmania martiniquensis]
MLRVPICATARGQKRCPSSMHTGPTSVAKAAFAALAVGGVRPQPRFRAQSVRCAACVRRTATVFVTLTCVSSACCTPMARLFTNAKRSYARGTEEEQQVRQEALSKEWRDLLSQPVDADGGNAPSARTVEDRLPTKKQLNDELPTAAELEKALREGKIDAYTMRPDEDED